MVYGNAERTAHRERKIQRDINVYVCTCGGHAPRQ